MMVITYMMQSLNVNNILFPLQVLLVHKASKGSFSRVFDFEANDLNGEENDARTR
jgi:hypothetical protein